jgi:hypothetical protein
VVRVFRMLLQLLQLIGAHSSSSDFSGRKL